MDLCNGLLPSPLGGLRCVMSPESARLDQDNQDDAEYRDVCGDIFACGETSFALRCEQWCRTATWSDGSEASLCFFLNCDTAGLAFEPGRGPTGDHGVGPVVGVFPPAAGRPLAGVVRVEGWAADINGIEAVRFGVDAVELSPANLSSGDVEPNSCLIYPIGIRHACRLDSGWSFDLDTRQFSDGDHVLQVLGTDGTGWSAVKKLRITIDNSQPLMSGRRF